MTKPSCVRFSIWLPRSIYRSNDTLVIIRTLFALPEQFEGAIVSGATQANLVALATERQWAAQRLSIDVSEEGLWSLPRCCSLAEQMGRGIELSPHFELLAPVHLNIVCFALRDADAQQRDHFLKLLTQDGQVLLTPTLYAGKPAIRAAFVNWQTNRTSTSC